jgi:hypothetical protein
LCAPAGRLQAADVGLTALLGRRSDPASQPQPPVLPRKVVFRLGAVIVLPGHANLDGLHQRLAFALAERCSQPQACRDPEALPRPLRLSLEDGASDERPVLYDFNLRIRCGVLALIGSNGAGPDEAAPPRRSVQRGRAVAAGQLYSGVGMDTPGRLRRLFVNPPGAC